MRPCLSQPGDGSRFRDVDLVIVRENTEDLYAGIEFDEGAAEVEELSQLVERSGQKAFAADSAISIKPISIAKSRRIVEYAFEYARRCGRKKVTAVHKANIMKATDGLFLRVAREVAANYPDIEFNDKIVDATCMGLVQNPNDFDVLVLPNLYGDIVSDLCAGLVGGLGMAPGSNIGADCAIFEATHGSAPDIAGQDIANPTAEILSAAMMLDHLARTTRPIAFAPPFLPRSTRVSRLPATFVVPRPAPLRALWARRPLPMPLSRTWPKACRLQTPK